MNEILTKIQTELKAPKNQHNSFGKYNYRSCEDILEALKPHLKSMALSLIISDEVVYIGNRYYVKATATLKTDTKEISATAYAREPEDRKGMDQAQLTGATSSYARKYALNGLFCIDDTKDADSTKIPNGDYTKEKPFKEPIKDDRGTLNKEKVVEKFNGEVVHQTKLISEKQGNRLWAIGKGKGVDENKVAEYIFDKYGYNNNTEIEVKNYDAIVKWVESQ